MINGSAEVNISGVIFPEDVRYFDDSKKLTFTIKSKGLNYKVSKIYCEYYKDDSYIINRKINHSQVYAKVVGKMVNNNKTGSLFCLVESVLVLGVHDSNVINRDKLDINKETNGSKESFSVPFNEGDDCE